jgi:hypothetical protein
MRKYGTEHINKLKGAKKTNMNKKSERGKG